MIHIASATLLLAVQSPGTESISWGAMDAWGRSWNRTDIASDGSVAQRSHHGDRPTYERCEPPQSEGSAGSTSFSLGEACSEKQNREAAMLTSAAMDKLAELGKNAPKTYEDASQ
ncbi:hypothetical protein [Sphingomonas koreensis]